MRAIRTLVILVVGMSLLAPALAAEKDPNLKLIKARQSIMQLRSFNAAPLFAMAKGKIDYDADLAGKMATNLQTLLELDMRRAWKKGTDNVAYPGKTEALPEIWSADSAIGKKGKDYAKAVDDLAAVAGNGLGALRETIDALGKGCKGCHDDYREKK